MMIIFFSFFIYRTFSTFYIDERVRLKYNTIDVLMTLATAKKKLNLMNNKEKKRKK
jgi:uncharacterized protein (DUF486 family)